MVKFDNEKIEITKENYSGNVNLGPSKSRLIRYIIISLLKRSKTTLLLPPKSKISDDGQRALNLLNVFGCKYERNIDEITIDSRNIIIPEKVIINVGESATLLRFFAVVSGLFENEFEFKTEGTLSKRPMEDLLKALESIGCESSYNDGVLTKKGKFNCENLKNIQVQTEKTSQIAGGLIILSAFSGQECTLNIGENPVSVSYIKMTIECLNEFGAGISFDEDKGIIFVSTENIDKENFKISVPEDESGKAVFRCANLLSGTNILLNENYDFFQPDSGFTNIAGNILKGDNVVSLRNVPDLVFLLTLVSCVSNHDVKFTDCERLSGKESDRLYGAVEFANALGVDAKIVDKDSFVIYGKEKICPKIIDAHWDHRLVFAAWAASLLSDDKIIIINSGNAFKKSFPDFFEKIKELESSK